DAKLLAACGVWLGWQALPAVLLLASLGGLMTFTVARLWLRRPLSAPVPFGPALSIAIWLLFIWQNR
ncbi:MAG TPA: prepilin peptidase, partial [Erwinia persicina]|nr:prepilin peptidase [Erwinia persicina]